MVLTLKNISKYAKQLSSSKYLRVLLVQDLKFGNEFIVKAYPRQECPTTKNLSISSIGQLEKVVSCRTIACSNQEENDSSQ